MSTHLAFRNEDWGLGMPKWDGIARQSCSIRVAQEFALFHRGPAPALLRGLLTYAPLHPLAVHQPLPGPLHHLHHLPQRHYHVHGALQPAQGGERPGLNWEEGPQRGVGVGMDTELVFQYKTRG